MSINVLRIFADVHATGLSEIFGYRRFWARETNTAVPNDCHFFFFLSFLFGVTHAPFAWQTVTLNK